MGMGWHCLPPPVRRRTYLGLQSQGAQEPGRGRAGHLLRWQGGQQLLQLVEAPLQGLAAGRAHLLQQGIHLQHHIMHAACLGEARAAHVATLLQQTLRCADGVGRVREGPPRMGRPSEQQQPLRATQMCQRDRSAAPGGRGAAAGFGLARGAVCPP
jgi:hypothetical protein